MKVVIYEPGKEGHRPVYLRYIDEALREAGCETIVVTKSYAQTPWALAALAAHENAHVVFICTMDGMFGWLAALGLGCRLHGVHVVGIYYLFNNLYEGWKGYLWRALLRLNLARAIFVPDLMYEENVPARLRDKIIRIPDAWDARTLKKLPREAGLRACGIQNAGSCVLLVLGAISQRKGIDKILLILQKWDFAKRPYLRLLIAGKIENDAKDYIESFLRLNPAQASAVTIADRWLTDEEICQCYAASSYLCAIYPKSFKVSISTVVRAFAVGRPVIVGDHGMIGEVVRKTEAGLVCDTANGESVRIAFEQAYDLYCMGKGGGTYERMATSGHSIAAESELERFKSTLQTWAIESDPHTRIEIFSATNSHTK